MFTTLWLLLRTKIHPEEKKHQMYKKMDQDLYSLYLEAFCATVEASKIHQVSRCTVHTDISMLPRPHICLRTEEMWHTSTMHYAICLLGTETKISTEEIRYAVSYCALSFAPCEQY